MKRLASIDAARGIASILVMLYHCNAVVQSPAYFGARPFGGFFGSGSVRMPFFFAMSGFMLSLVHGRDLGRPERLRRYVLGRFARIYPAYWVVLALMTPAYLKASGGVGGPDAQGVWGLLGSVFLLPQPQLPYLAVAWTLQTLMVFYLVVALAIWRRWVGAAVFVVWQAVALGALAAGSQPAFPWSFLLQTLYLDLLPGAVVAQVVLRGGVRNPGAWLVCGAGYLGVALLMDFAGSPLWPKDWPLLVNGVAASAMLLGLAGWERSRTIQVPRVLLACGAASYSIFLIHYPLLSVLSKAGKAAGLGKWLSGELIFVGFAGFCIVAGIGFHRWIEEPLTRWVQVRMGLARSSAGGEGAGGMKGKGE